MRTLLLATTSLLALCAVTVSASATTFNFQYGVYQSFIAPTQGLYDITAFGAQGGAGSGGPGGLGAEVSGDFHLSQGESLLIMVGGEGNPGNNCCGGGGGGGGGGSFVALPAPSYTLIKPLAVAGGGGGGFSGGAGGAGQAGPNGASGSGRGGAGGTGGGGGGTGRFSAVSFYVLHLTGGAGGGGFTGNGAIGRTFGGLSFQHGGNGGGLHGPHDIYFESGKGGYGGGGSGGGNHYDSGGGGGGYSGGGGGGGGYEVGHSADYSYVSGGGGGGGSYNGGQHPISLAGVHSGNGYVTIDEVAAPEPSDLSLFATALAGFGLLGRRRRRRS